MAQAVATIRPYADLIQSSHGESKSWLVNFLRKGYNIRHWEPRNPYIDIYILDTTDGTMSCQHFRPHRSDEADALFLTALGARPSNSKTRLVLVQVGHLGDMNPAYLDAIGWCYRLDPHFFSTILQDALYLCEGERFGGLGRLPVTLPSESGHITVATDTLGSFANAAILKSDGLNTTHSSTLIYESHTVTLEYLKSKTKIWVLAMFLIGSQMDGLDLATES
ncbi:hypothetical protein NHJ13734_007440 [Beauveria thailandica]